jgi:glycosyltransferase involved in cell wall biosynthesis
MTPVASIIVPAHNEATTIGRCLDALTDGARPGELEIIVVCNGCTDRTAAEARRFERRGVTVIETDVASKVSALNLGDAAAHAFPRLYVDADVVIDRASVLTIVSNIITDRLLAAGPQIELDLSGSSWPVRAFYRIDSMLPSHRHGIGGSGVYALSKQGRRRFKQFPDVTADDAFVRRLFDEHERRRVPHAVSVVTPPRRLAGLVRIKTRTHLGNYELKRLGHVARAGAREAASGGSSNRAALAALALRPALWAHLVVYAYVKIVARLRARYRLYTQNRAWERDDTSRQTRATSRESRRGADARATADAAVDAVAVPTD